MYSALFQWKTHISKNLSQIQSIPYILKFLCRKVWLDWLIILCFHPHVWFWVKYIAYRMKLFKIHVSKESGMSDQKDFEFYVYILEAMKFSLSFFLWMLEK